MLPERELCNGCGACKAICPHKCINMVEDREGFRYPVIEASKCVSCGLCELSCPIISANKQIQTGETAALAVQNQDDVIRENSSSGGVFTALADYTLKNNGYVCAAIYDEQFNVKHIISNLPEDIASMRGAKYTQSISEECYLSIKRLLQEGCSVLFVGTPCQTGGLTQFLGRKYDNLLLVDMVCHGVPSPFVWKQYLSERKKVDSNKADIISINQRSKATGWSRYAYCVTIKYENGAEYSLPQGQDLFMKGFVQNLYLRPSCSHCFYKGIERCSDITLGDCWGIWDIVPEFDDNKGTSLILIHSQHGKRVWDRISSGFRVIPLSIEQAIAQNPSIVSSSSPHRNREKFYSYVFSGKSIIQAIQDGLSYEQKRSLFQKIRDLVL